MATVERPERGSPEWDLWIAAIEVAIYPPLKPHTYTTRVAKHKIDELREALDGVGIDWRAAKAKEDARLAERRRA